MKWSWKIGEFRGIGVYMHATFLVLIGFIVQSHWSAHGRHTNVANLSIRGTMLAVGLSSKTQLASNG